jgi:hypothetical protein
MICTPRLHSRQLSTILFLGTIFLLGSGKQCSGQNCWTRTYGFSGIIDTIIPTADGNFVSFGTMWSDLGDNAQRWDIFLMKSRPDGDTIWLKKIRKGLSTEFYSVHMLSNSDFVAVGSTIYHQDGNNELLLMKLSADGDTLSTRSYGNENSLFEVPAQHVLPLADGSFLYGINRIPSGSTASSCWVLNFNAAGDTNWTKTIGVSGSDFYLNKMMLTNDGNILLNGTTENDLEIYKISLVKIASTGKTLWERNYDTVKSRDVRMLLGPTTGGGALLVVGEVVSSDPAIGDVTIKWIGSDGTPVRDKKIGGGGFDFLVDLSIQTDGIILLGTSDTPVYNLSLAKVSMDGLLLWKKTFYRTLLGSGIIPGTCNGFLISIQDGDNRAIWKFNNCGDTVWNAPMGKRTVFSPHLTYTHAENYILLGYDTEVSSDLLPSICTIIDDRTASKNTLFTFKIPSLGSDTTNIGIAALKTPAGMTVSAGGTISWTPTTDSSYREHVAFVVVNDLGRKDTVSFNIAVNPVTCVLSAIPVVPTGLTAPARQALSLSATEQNGSVRFLLPAAAGYIDIYDMTGRRTGRVAPVATGSSATAVWPGSSGTKSAPGTYVAKTTVGGRTLAKPFMLR